MNTIKVIFTAVAISLASTSFAAVTKTADGNYVADKSAKTKAVYADTITGKTYTDKKGVKYDVFKNKDGKEYIGKTSKKSGKYYRDYSPFKDPAKK